MSAELKTFESFSKLELDALALLRDHLGPAGAEPHAVMLSGGRTPLGLYEHIEKRPFEVDPGLSLVLSDERYVSIESPESNFGRMRGMVEALGLERERILRPHTELPLEQAAQRYHEELAAFLGGGGRLTLGLLGLGPDGHTCSLFSAADVTAGRGYYAAAVRRDDGPDRVTVTADLLERLDRVVLMVSGRHKHRAVRRLIDRPADMPAGLALQGVANVEIWYSEE